MSFNEVDPRMARIIGGERGPTVTEQAIMAKAMLTMAMTTVAGACLQSLLESGATISDSLAEEASTYATKLLDKTEEARGDFDGSVEKQKIRNQLAANLLYSALRGGADEADLVTKVFDLATSTLENAIKYAENDSTSPSIVTP